MDDQGRSIVASLTTEHAYRNGPPIGKRALRIMARRAGDGAVAREAAVEEQPPPWLDLFRGEWIILWDGQVEVQSQRDDYGGAK